MPLNSSQLAELVERARHKAPPVVSPPLPAPSPPRSVRQRRDASAAQALSAALSSPRSEVPTLTPEAPTARAFPPQPEKPAPLPAEPATPDDSPWFLDKSSWRLSPPVLRRVPPPHAARRIFRPAQADPLRPCRASRRELLARHVARQQQGLRRRRHQLAADHHPAQELAASSAGRIGGCRRRGRKSVPTRLSRAPSTLRTGSPCPV